MPKEVLSGLSPEQKADVVRATPHAMMIGDGINDSLAMMKADVGLAVSGGVESALKSSSVYLTENGLKGVYNYSALVMKVFVLCGRTWEYPLGIIFLAVFSPFMDLSIHL